MSKIANRTKIHIVQAAIELFSVQGFGSTSIREIADQANVNSALISYHFKNKQGILEYIMVQYFEGLFMQLEGNAMGQAEEDTDCFDEFMKMVQIVIRFQSEHMEVTRIIQRELSVDSMLVREVMSTYIAKLKAFFSAQLDKGIQQGQFQPNLNQDIQLIHVMSSIFFPYFNPQIIREVFYVDPISEEYTEGYIRFLSKTWRYQFEKGDFC